jgi:pilus assembly protein CpaC
MRRDRVLAVIGAGLFWASEVFAVPIEVQVEVAEINHTKASQVGVDWNDSLSWSEASIAGAGKIGRIVRIDSLQAKLKLLVDEGAAEVLANPNLITDSGTVATFQAGGELPYITNSSLGATNVEFKKYGVSLRVEPALLMDGRIEMAVRAAVSAPDHANGVLVSGNSVPAIAEREVTSHVTLAPGTALALAGLVQSQKEVLTSGVPILRKIPLLGGLFRWKRISNRRTSVVIFLTPKLKEI